MASTSSASDLKMESEKFCFGGWVRQYSHTSTSTQTKMVFSVFVPAQAKSDMSGDKVPVLYFLSGLTCTDQNFTTKAGAQRCAGLVIRSYYMHIAFMRLRFCARVCLCLHAYL